jgi:pimeloyl-ACP methyl ester carboxylesterase
MKFPGRLLNLSLVLVILCSLAGAQETGPPRKEGDLWFEPFQMQVDGKAYDGELGRLAVRENRKNPKSNLIELAFVRLKSTAGKPGYPVVYLDGGPGSSAINIARVPEYMRAFQKLLEVGDVILLDQRGVGRSKPNLSWIAPQSLPLDVFADKQVALQTFQERARTAVNHFRSKNVDVLAYNNIESAHDVDDLRKALKADKVNLVGFSYGTHLGLACIRYHGAHLNRVVLVGTEGPDHTEKLPSTSDTSLRRLAEVVARAPELQGKLPDLVGTLKRLFDRFEKDPVVVRITDSRGRKPIDVKVGKFGLQHLIFRDLGDTNDLPIFPAWIYTMDKGDWSILSRFVERRYNQYGQGLSVMTVVMDTSSGATKARRLRIERESRSALLSDAMNFPILNLGSVIDNLDLGDGYRLPIRTTVPTLFFSGDFDNQTPPFQADEVRRLFKSSTHIIVKNAGHESILTESRVQQAMVDYLRGQDVSSVQVSLPPLKFVGIPEEKKPSQ